MIDNKNVSKLYRYEALLQAIDFFTQKFNLEQLSYYAFEFSNEILTLNSSALFLIEGDAFKLKKTRYYKAKNYKIQDCEQIQRIALFYGDIITANFENFFTPEDVAFFNARLVIPLLIQDKVHGFIISDGKAVDNFDEDDLIIARALMRLINNSLENSKNFSDLQFTNKQLDQKIFNLFSINQSSRALLSVLDLNKLYSLAIDIFSELTSSKVTAFGLYDEIRDRIIVRGYKNVFSSNKYYGEFQLFQNKYSGYKMVFHYREDAEALRKLFVNYADFEGLEAEYVILLVREQILGFVTISKPVNDRCYDGALFELVESLATSTFISVTNAMLFEEVNRQKNIIEQKFKVLTKLNLLIKNINSCIDIDELCSLTMKTLHVSFGIKKAFIVLYENHEYRIKDHFGFETTLQRLEPGESWEQLQGNGTFCRYTGAQNSSYLPAALLEDVGESNCFVISPIQLGSLELDEADRHPLGCIVVLQTSQSLKEEEVLLFDTIANSIAPIINHMNTIAQIKKEYMPNYRELFLEKLSAKLRNKRLYFIDFKIYYKKFTGLPLNDPDLSMYAGMEHFYFDSILFVLSELELNTALFDGVIEASDMPEALEKIKGIALA